MDIQTAYRKVTDSADFDNKGALAHFFTEIDEQLKPGGWQVGFYDKATDKITTYIVNGKIEKQPSEDVFKKEGTIVRELVLDSVTITVENAIKKAVALQKEKYPQHPFLKGIVILQNIEQVVWNITFVTRSFAALNIRVDAKSGEIVHDGVQTFFGVDKQNI